MVSFRDSYNDMLKKRGGSVVDSTLNVTQQYIERHFREDPSCKAGFKLNVFKNEPIDFRVSNTIGSGNMDRNTDIKKMIFRPSANIASGDYVKQDNSYWLVTECEHNSVQPKAIGYDCNNKLRLIVDNIATDVYAYFLKGTFTIQDGEFVKLNDSNLTCMVGTYYKNIVDKFFKESKTRFLINNKAFKIDGIDDITGINKNHGIYTITLKSDVLNPLDDLENGIAYNEDKPSLPEVFVINGKDKITKGIEETFMISPLKTGISFKLDDWSIENNLAQVVSQSDGKCIVKGLVANEQIILSAYEGINEICNKTIGIVR